MFGIQDIGKKVTFRVENGEERRGTITSAQFNGVVDIREHLTGEMHYSVAVDNVTNAAVHVPVPYQQAVLEVTEVNHFQYGNRYVVLENFPFGEYAYIDEKGKYRTIGENECQLVSTVGEAREEIFRLLMKGSGVGFEVSSNSEDE